MSFVHNRKIFKGPLRRKGGPAVFCCVARFFFFYPLVLIVRMSHPYSQQQMERMMRNRSKRGLGWGLSDGLLDVIKKERRDWLRRKERLELKWVRGQDSRSDAHHSDYGVQCRHRMHFCEILTVTNTDLIDRYSTSNCKLMAQSESVRDFKAKTHSDLHANPCFTRV